jgi:hypothetical protein
MVALTIQQKKALAGYRRTWKVTPGAGIEISDSATDRFCELLLQDPPWGEMWSVDDVRRLIEETQTTALHSESKQVLADPAVLCKELEDRLQAELESYPRDYFVYVELPGLDPDFLDEELLVLSDQIALVRTSAPFKKIERLVRPNFPVGLGNLLADVSSIEEAREALRPVSDFLLEQDSVYLRVTESGALLDFLFGEESALLPRALTTVKIVVFYGLEIGLFKRREIFRSRHHDPGPRTIAHVAIHAMHGDEQQPEQMSRDLENFMRGVTFNYSDEKRDELSSCRNVEADLQPVVRFLSILRADANAQRIAAGIEWLIDSLVTTNQTLSLVQSCIGIEAILGDSTPGAYELGITARLSERFAYLMGTSAENRNALRDQFRLVFAKRGDLVHARRHRLPPHELQVVQIAQKMLQELIRKELSLMLDLSPGVLSQMDSMEIKLNMRPF